MNTATQQYKPYPTYKPSGVDGMPPVPEHWDIKKLKHISRVSLSNVDKKSVDSERSVRLCNYVDVYYRDYISDDIDFMKATASNAQVAKFELRAGDVMITKDSEDWDDIAVPAVVPRDLPGVVCGYHLAHIRPSRMIGEYLFRAFMAEGIREQFKVAANGITRYGIGSYSIANSLFCVPPLPEQRMIADFLDRETGRIDALIEKKRRLIELLEEKRTALISHAVTKGLDPAAPMKPSGIEWLGDIPAHWEVKMTKFAATLESGHTPSRQHPEYWEDCDIPWFTLSDVWQLRGGRTEYVVDTKEKVSKLGLANSSARLLPAHTVMLSRTASVGFSGIMGVDMATTQDFANWICQKGMRPEYLLYVFRAMALEFERLKYGSTHNTIYMPDIEQFRCPVPSVEEQDAIVRHIRSHAKQIDSLIDKNRAVINKLQERRTALISAAVTGKIDVRMGTSACAVQTEES